MFDFITLSFRNMCFVFYNLEKGTELCFEINLPFSYTKKKGPSNFKILLLLSITICTNLCHEIKKTSKVAREH